VRTSLLPLLAFASAAIAQLASAATLRVPQDFSTIQRAVFAADPGDTVEIAPGTYHEHIVIHRSVTLAGAGIGKTIIIGPDRGESIIRGQDECSIVIRDLSIGHTDEAQPDAYAEIASFNTANVDLQNIEVTRSSNDGLKFAGCKRVRIRNVSVKNTEAYAVGLAYCKDFVVENLTADAALKRHFIDIDSSVGLVKNVSAANLHEGFITVWRASKVQFEAIDAKHRENLNIGEYDDSPPEGEYALTPEEAAAEAAQQAAYRAERLKLYERVSALNRKLQEDSPAGASLEKQTTALRNYLGALVEQTTDIGSFTGSEFRAFTRLHGIAALNTTIAVLPFKPDDYYKTAQEYYDAFLPKTLVTALTEHRARSTIKDTFDLPTVLGSWRTADGTANATDAAAAFYDMTKTISNKAETSSAEETKILKAALLKEVGPFVEKQGFASLDELITRLAQSPLPIITPDEVREQLTPQQKRAFAKFLIQ
jgi:hypothetical protein